VTTARIIRVFLASPGGMETERLAVREAIDSTNLSILRTYGCVLVPVDWHSGTRSSYGERPQSAINRNAIDVCDALIAVFHHRIGRKSELSDSYTTEEIEYAHKKGKTVLVYFSDEEMKLSALDDEELKRLSDFKKKIQDISLFKQFDTSGEFREILRTDLEILARDHSDLKGELPKSIQRYLLQYPSFDVRGELNSNYVRTSKESFFHISKLIIDELQSGANIYATDRIRFDSTISYWFTEGVKYLSQNFEAHKRGINLERIFIVNGGSLNKNIKKMEKLLTLHSMCGVKCYVVPIEQTPPEVREEFCIFDDKYIDEVKYDCDGHAIVENKIYWSQSYVDKYTSKFEILKSYARRSMTKKASPSENAEVIFDYASLSIEDGI
jgi:nucleoside 2-deoxyribosyltransferase